MFSHQERLEEIFHNIVQSLKNVKRHVKIQETIVSPNQVCNVDGMWGFAESEVSMSNVLCVLCHLLTITPTGRHYWYSLFTD